MNGEADVVDVDGAKPDCNDAQQQRLANRSTSFSPPDYSMSQNCALILANLLHNVNSHEAAVLGGAIRVMIMLAKSRDERTKECAALAFFNLSANTESCGQMMRHGAAAALITMLSTAQSLQQRRCG